MPIVTTSSHNPSKRNPKLPVAIAAIVIVAVIAFYLGTRTTQPKPQTSVPDTTATPAATAQDRNPDAASMPGATGDATSVRSETKNGTQRTDIDDDALATTNVSGTASDNPAERAVPQRKPHKRKFFDNQVENQLEVLSNRAVRFKNLPRTRLSDEEIMEYLRKPISIEADDDAETVAAKERTAEMKTLALKYIEEGGTYEQFIQEQAKASTEEAETRRAVHAEAIRILKSEGLQAAEEYLSEVNPQLKEAGLQEVGIPLALKKKAEVEAEERAAAEKAQ